MRAWLMFPLFVVSGLATAASGLLHNARIHTLDPEQPQAEALAWDASGRILALGEIDALRKRWPDATLVDAQGRTVVPGLIDAHGHLMGLGYALLRADLVGAASKAEVVERLQRFASDLPDGAWLLGRGWDQNDWPEKEFPTAADLDAAFPERPVWLERVDGTRAGAIPRQLRRPIVASMGIGNPRADASCVPTASRAASSSTRR